MKTQNFGVEIELTGVTRKTVAGVIAKYFGTHVIYNGGSYNTYIAEDRKARRWKVMSDSSIKPMVKESNRIVYANEQYRVEIVTPILQYSDIEDLQEIIRAVRRKGGFATELCGIHIHIDASKHTPKTLKNLINIIASKEDILYKTLRIKEERVRYCKKVNEELISVINKKKPKTLDELADIWYSEYPNDDRTRHYNNTRYHGLNLHSTFTKGTVEFRCFNSSCKRTITDNPKYAFRCWMLRLGLIGDEFKTCRHHFIKNLEGDSAWRNVTQRHTVQNISGV